MSEAANLAYLQEQPYYLALEDEIEVLHVNGHVGVEGNELADRMSILAIESRVTDFTRYRKDIEIASILATRLG